MGFHDSPLITLPNIEYLLSGVARAVTVGGMGWHSERQGDARVGEVRIETAVSALEPCRLQMYISRFKPSEPALLFLAGPGRRGFPARRLCVNGRHGSTLTHKHRIFPTGWEDTYEPDDIPEVPLQPRVAPGTYRAILEAFAAECKVSLGEDFVWTEPWEE